MAGLPPNSAIATRCRDCSTLFHQLLTAIQGDLLDSPSHDQITESFVQDELGRFRVWLGNVGAHRSGRISLDYRLREAANMRDSVLELLKDLGDNIREGWFISYFKFLTATRIKALHDDAVQEKKELKNRVNLFKA